LRRNRLVRWDDGLLIVAAAFSAAVLFVLGPSATGGEGTGGKEAEIPWGEETEGYRLGLSTDKAEFAPGERVELHMIFRNVGPDDAEVPVSRLMVFHTFTVLLPSGKEAPLTLYGQRQVQSRLDPGGRGVVVLKPGEERSLDLHLNRLFDMTLTGTYKVTAKRAVWTRGEPRETAHVVSNTLEITIKERPVTDSE
jgi:hypothetical protein